MTIVIGGNTLSGNFNSLGDSQNAPNVVTDGLVLWLDAGNNASYINSSNYYDCGYGCQYYSSNPGCTNCNTQWKDMSGNGHDGTFNSTSLSYLYGGGSIYFNGSSGYVNITSTSLLNPSTGVITTSAWFYSTAVGTENGSIILNKESEYEISAGGGYVTYAFRPNWAWVGRTAFNINTWNHVVVAYDQVNQYFYLNGTLVYQAALTGAIGNAYANDLRIGARGAPSSANSFFQGYISIVTIHNKALTASQILQNYNNGRIRFGV
jgi:hypothetical protein